MTFRHSLIYNSNLRGKVQAHRRDKAEVNPEPLKGARLHGRVADKDQQTT